jgi:hypothetical protein
MFFTLSTLSTAFGHHKTIAPARLAFGHLSSYHLFAWIGASIYCFSLANISPPTLRQADAAFGLQPQF